MMSTRAAAGGEAAEDARRAVFRMLVESIVGAGVLSARETEALRDVLGFLALGYNKHALPELRSLGVRSVKGMEVLLQALIAQRQELRAIRLAVGIDEPTSDEASRVR